MEIEKIYVDSDGSKIKDEIIRYVNFWPFFFVSVIICLGISLTYLRYAEYLYETSATIEIIDEAQDSEMALPTSLTVFNRSMINLENEINIISSYSLNSEVVRNLNSNFEFYTAGNIKTTQNHPDEWINDYSIDFKINSDSVEIFQQYDIEFEDSETMYIQKVSDFSDELKYRFVNLSTKSIDHDLPFDLVINDIENLSNRSIIINPFSVSVKNFKSLIETTPLGQESDQLSISMNFANRRIAEEYLNTLLDAFDKDGIEDRQLEYKNTIEFVDKRSEILKDELELIELKKQNFKQTNNLSDLKSDASLSIQEQYVYNNEIFDSESQKKLAKFLLDSISSDDYDYLALNIGLENFDLNVIISEYNQILRSRDKYLIDAGPNNYLVKSSEKQLKSFRQNIIKSLENYINSLDIKINSLQTKENEFGDIYRDVPLNEKILRTIERELSVKEALFLLLLQKREEAAINFAVVKPTIKIIDFAMSNDIAVSPNRNTIILGSLFTGLFIPFLFLYVRFLLDNKIHHKDQLIKKLGDSIPVIGEIPHITEKNKLNEIVNNNSRTPLSESIRMLIANLKFTFSIDEDKKDGTVILVTSSVKGEGKTVISCNTASLISNENRVLLVGADLRNPQIHKLISKEKNIKGLSDIIYKNDINNYEKHLIKYDKFDILLSGTIPPNPSELLSSQKFKNFIELVKSKYDYVVIDSAPCLLVSDTFEISELSDVTLYIFRANYTDSELTEFIQESRNQQKLKNINLILNSVGNSRSYGYKYGYQYGYKYGYKYSYNYGYGYGYTEDKS